MNIENSDYCPARYPRPINDFSPLVALLAPQLKAAAKDFILQLLPETANGMRLADRNAQLAKIDAEIERIEAERQGILQAVREAGKGVSA